jgi:predicted Zn-dependent peptidase
MIVMGTAVNQNAAIDSIATAKKIADSLSTTSVAPNEIERARKEVLDEGNAALSKPESLPDGWLDMDTYRLTEAQERTTAIQSVSPGDVQRVASRLLKDAPVATVIAGDAAQLKPLLQSRVQFEVLGETPSSGPNTKPPTKPATPSSPR